jgi:hypothetical protein
VQATTVLPRRRTIATSSKTQKTQVKTQMQETRNGVTQPSVIADSRPPVPVDTTRR